MEKVVEQIFADSIVVKQETLKKNLPAIVKSSQSIIDAFQNGHKLFFCGNGGSAADSQHIAAEFVGRFQKERKAWPARSYGGRRVGKPGGTYGRKWRW